jgi:hypothetical protein
MEEQQQPRRRGRPPTGVTPKRNVRIGAVWDEAERHAAAEGITTTAYVERALRAENTRVERAARRAASRGDDQPAAGE